MSSRLRGRRSFPVLERRPDVLVPALRPDPLAADEEEHAAPHCPVRERAVAVPPPLEAPSGGQVHLVASGGLVGQENPGPLFSRHGQYLTWSRVPSGLRPVLRIFPNTLKRARAPLTARSPPRTCRDVTNLMTSRSVEPGRSWMAVSTSTSASSHDNIINFTSVPCRTRTCIDLSVPRS